MPTSNQLELESQPAKLEALSEPAQPNPLESAAYLQAVLDSMLDGILTCDETGTIRSFNQAAEKIFGYRAAEIIGQNINLLIPAPHLIEHDTYISNYPQTGKGHSIGLLRETMGQHKDGSIFSMELAVNEARVDGRYVFTAICRDITESKLAQEALRESEERYRRIIEISLEGVWKIDLNGNTTFVNQRMAEMLGYSISEMAGKPLFAFTDDEGKAIAEAYIERRRQGIDEQHDFKFSCKDGTELWTIVSTNSLFDAQGQYNGALAMITDITQRKYAETALQKANEELESRVQSRPTELKDAYDKLLVEIGKRKQAEEEARNAMVKEKELHELKTRFISLTSHEFRTPLTSILTAAELLQYHNQKLSEDKKLELLQRIQTSVSQMTELLNNVLTIERVEAGKLGFEPVPLDVVKFCSDLVDDLGLGIAAHHYISFSNTIQSKTLNLDEKLLRHILLNLLSNAIKYSPSGSTIDFQLSQSGDEVIFQVKDNGIGIPLDDQSRLFELFHRGKNVGTISGTGLGLAIVKRSVDLHGGKIEVASALGAGSTFTVTLPLKPTL